MTGYSHLSRICGYNTLPCFVQPAMRCHFRAPIHRSRPQHRSIGFKQNEICMRDEYKRRRRDRPAVPPARRSGLFTPYLIETTGKEVGSSRSLRDGARKLYLAFDPSRERDH
ncbi:hypothetical protein Daesc_007570 [Daldinia eschscholtzii]|uniref:Uncharacterized protein n=1 Tax=Daldinia eschscholtzii TaxID=292717 RepID=A0AAX6MFU1_9PEZI